MTRSLAKTSCALVTGGAGFIGSHVCDLFLEEGYEVVAVDDLSNGRRNHVPSRAKFVQLDIVDAEKLGALVKECRPAVVAHLAAQSSVTVSVSEPLRDLRTNVEGTMSVLVAAAEVGAHVIFASTGGALYGDGAPIPTSEDAVHPEPLAPYGASKLAGEAYVRTWGRLHGMPNVVLRLGNVFGPRQLPGGEAGVVAIFSNALRRGEPPVVFGNGQQTRDYIHVNDVARAFLVTAERHVAGTYNVGLGRETSVLHVLEILQEAAGTSIAPQFEPLRSGELMRSCLDASRLRGLGWAPRVELRRGFTETFLAGVDE